MSITERLARLSNKFYDRMRSKAAQTDRASARGHGARRARGRVAARRGGTNYGVGRKIYQRSLGDAGDLGTYIEISPITRPPA